MNGSHGVTTQRRGPVLVIEVDGALGLIAAHDLRRAFLGALADTEGGPSRELGLDLSSVSAVDSHGIAALHWCRDQAIAHGRRLMWTGCSQPLRRALALAA